MALQVPEGVLTEMKLTGEGHRGLGDYQVILEVMNVVTTVVSLATIRPQLELLAMSIRQWIGSHDDEHVILKVKGPDGFEVKMRLRRNISRLEILEALSLLAEDKA